MIRTERRDARVLVARDPIVAFHREDNEFLKSQLQRDGLDRLRICSHRSTDDRLHEMLMAFSRSTYIRPSQHVDKEESIFVLEGLGKYVFFDERGRISATVPLGPVGSGRSFYCRIPANTFHCLLVESDVMLVKETTSGPFRRSDTVFASWSPDGTDPKAVREYLSALQSTVLEIS